MNSLSPTDTYLSLFSQIQLSPTMMLGYFFLTIARIIPVMVFPPFFGSKNLPASIRILFSICFCAIFLPQILLSSPPPLNLNVGFAIYLIKELFIGFILAFLITIPFLIAQSSGNLVEHMRGASSLQVTDPTTKTTTSPLGIFYNLVLIVVFFAMDGPILFIDAIGKSFELIPPYAFFNTAFFTANRPFWHMALSLIQHVLTIAIQLAAPPLIGILMAEMFLGIANRLAPQVQIVFLGIPLKSWVGLAMLASAWYYITKQLSVESMSWIKLVNLTILQMVPK